MPPTNPLQAFCVGDVRFDAPTGPDAATAAEYRGSAIQQLGPQFADHRGRIDLPALAVLFDHIGGLPYYAARRSATIQARLSLSAQGYVDVDDRLTGTSRLVMHDDEFGTTEVALTTSTGHTICVGTARNVRVGRAIGGDAEIGDEPVPDHVDGSVVLPPPISPEVDGATIVAEIAAGARPPGPIVEFLNGRIEIRTVADDNGHSDSGHEVEGLRFIARTDPWMGNMFGTMHGGVIATILGQACSLAGQAHAPAGRSYRVGDLTASFLRSPAVQGSEVIVDVVPVKVGRRIASLRATMNSHDGTLLAAATSDIQYF